LEVLVERGRKKNKLLLEDVGKPTKAAEKEAKLNVLHSMIDTF